MTESIRTMVITTNGSRIENIKPLIQPNPAAQKQSTSLPETELQGNLQTLNFWICPSMFHGTPTYTFRNSQERVVELIRSKYVHIPGNSWQFSWDKYDVLTTNSQWILVIAIVNFWYHFLRIILVDWLIFHSFSLRLQFNEDVCNKNNTGNE